MNNLQTQSMAKAKVKDVEVMLTAKEKRYVDYHVKCREEGFSPTIGDVCKACHTTPWTLLGKTEPSLMKKLELFC